MVIARCSAVTYAGGNSRRRAASPVAARQPMTQLWRPPSSWDGRPDGRGQDRMDGSARLGSGSPGGDNRWLYRSLWAAGDGNQTWRRRGWPSVPSDPAATAAAAAVAVVVSSINHHRRLM